MMHELDWTNLQDRRKDIRLTILYKIINELANVLNKKHQYLQIPELEEGMVINFT